MRIHVLHDCHIDGQTVRHRNPIEYHEVPLNDPDRHERTEIDLDTGAEWISRNYGPWEPLIEFPEQPWATSQPSPDVEGQPSLFEESA